jgi:hypothetical protein
MDITQILASLAEASDADLQGALDFIAEQAKPLREATSREDVDQLVGYADQAKQVKAEQDRRTALADDKAAALAALPEGKTEATDGDLATKPTGGPKGDPIDGDTDQDKAEAKGQKTAPSSTGAKGGATTAAGAPLGAATAARGDQGASANAGTITATRTLSAEVRGFNMGQQLGREQMAAAMATRMNDVFTPDRGGASADGAKHHVVSFNLSYPEDRVLSRDATWTDNTRKIEAGQDPQAITAAGGFCAPLEIIYDIDTIGVTDRPVMNALNRFQVERGGIQYRPPFDALGSDVLGESGHTGGLGIWTAADDASVPNPPDDSVVKGCAVVDCPGLLAASVYSTYLCMEFPNFTSRFDPEWADATTQAALIAAARFMENQLLTRLLNGSTDGTQTGDPGSKLLIGPGTNFNWVAPGAAAGPSVSSARDMLVTLDRSVAYYRSRHRLNDVVPLTFILPRWVRELIRADMTRGFALDMAQMAVANATIDGWFAARGVTPVWHLDGLAQTQIGGTANVMPQQFYDNAAAGSQVPEFPQVVDTALFATGDWLYLDGGVLDLGLVRDSVLNARNRYRTFTESFEGLAFRGIESLRLGIVTGKPSGATVGTISPQFINS